LRQIGIAPCYSVVPINGFDLRTFLAMLQEVRKSLSDADPRRKQPIYLYRAQSAPGQLDPIQVRFFIGKECILFLTPELQEVCQGDYLKLRTVERLSPENLPPKYMLTEL
jgi:hypothetical protein